MQLKLAIDLINSYATQQFALSVANTQKQDSVHRKLHRLPKAETKF